MHSLQKLHLEISITWVKVHQLALPQAESKTNRTSILGFTASFNYYYIQIWLIFKLKEEITSKKLLIMFLVAKLTLNLWIKMFLTIWKKIHLGKFPKQLVRTECEITDFWRLYLKKTLTKGEMIIESLTIHTNLTKIIKNVFNL